MCRPTSICRACPIPSSILMHRTTTRTEFQSTDRPQLLLRSAPTALPTSLIPIAAPTVELDLIAAPTVPTTLIAAQMEVEDRTAAKTAEPAHTVAQTAPITLTAAPTVDLDQTVARTAASDLTVAPTELTLPIAAFRSTNQHQRHLDRHNDQLLRRPGRQQDHPFPTSQQLTILDLQSSRKIKPPSFQLLALPP